MHSNFVDLAIKWTIAAFVIFNRYQRKYKTPPLYVRSGVSYTTISHPFVLK